MLGLENNRFKFIIDERVGNLNIVVNDPSVIVPMRSQITLLVRGSYSNPPNHGARVVSKILNDPAQFSEWYEFIVFSFIDIFRLMWSEGLSSSTCTICTERKGDECANSTHSLVS